MKKLLGWLVAFLIFSSPMSSLMAASFYFKIKNLEFDNFINDKISIQVENKEQKNKIIKRQTTIKYDLEQETETEKNNGEDDTISLISSLDFSPSRFWETCDDLLDEFEDIDSTLEENQVMVEDNVLEPSPNKKARIESRQEVGALYQEQLVNSQEAGPSQVTSRPPLISLKKIIKNRDLGTLENGNPDTILRALARLNPDVDQRQMRIKSFGIYKLGGFWCDIISRSSNLQRFSGLVRIYFNLVKTAKFGCNKTLLSNVLHIRDLGTLENGNPDTILRALARLNPDVDEASINLTLPRSNIDGSFTIIVRSSRSIGTLYSGAVTIHFKLKNVGIKEFKKKLLSQVIYYYDLGTLKNSNRPTILSAIARLNPGFDQTSVNLNCLKKNDNGKYSVRVRPKQWASQFYLGSIYVSFTLQEETTAAQDQPGPSGLQTNQDLEHAESILIPSLSEFSPSYFLKLCDNLDLYDEQSVEEQEGSQDLTTIISDPNLGFLENNDETTILQRLHIMYPTLNLNYIAINFLQVNDYGMAVWQVAPIVNSNYYHSTVEVYFMTDNNFVVNHVQVPPINLQNKLWKNSKIINHYNSLSMPEKQKRLKKLKTIGSAALARGINSSETKKTAAVSSTTNNKQEDEKAAVVTTSLISGGGLIGISKMTGISPINALGNSVKMAVSTVRSSITTALSTEASATTAGTANTMEMTPLLSTTGELTAAETLTAEATATVVGEGTIIGTEAGVSASLAPETLGLSLVIGGIVMIGTGILYWTFGPNHNDTKVKTTSPKLYNCIEKYHKPFTYNQLKISIAALKWERIRFFYQKYSSDYATFLVKVKAEIADFQKVTGLFGDSRITDDHLKILVKVIFDNFQTINNRFLSTTIYGLKIVTNTVGGYFEFED